MDEIAENDNISKNAVSKQLIGIKEKLNYYEDMLKLNFNREKIEEILSSTEYINKIEEYI